MLLPPRREVSGSPVHNPISPDFFTQSAFPGPLLALSDSRPIFIHHLPPPQGRYTSCQEMSNIKRETKLKKEKKYIFPLYHLSCRFGHIQISNHRLHIAVRKAKKKKAIKALRVKLPTRSQAIDTFIGDEEQTEEKTKRKKREWLPTQLPWTIYLVSMTHVRP